MGVHGWGDGACRRAVFADDGLGGGGASASCLLADAGRITQAMLMDTRRVARDAIFSVDFFSIACHVQ